MTALTNTAIEALAKGDEIKDDRVPGLSVRRTGAGFSYMLYYRTKAGKQRRPKIGTYPMVPIAKAREIAKELLISVAAGGDPVAERTQLRDDPVMDDLWTRCEQEHWTGDKPWDKEAKRLWTKHAQKALGRMKVRDVSYDDVAKIFKKLGESDGNHTIAVLSKMFNLAEKFGPEGRKWRPLGSNPCQHVERHTVRKRKRYAKPQEISEVAALLEAEAVEHPEQAAFVYLLMFSGARPSEIVNAEPHQIERHEKVADDGTVIVYGVLRLHGKTSDATGEDRAVFLPPQAMAVIAKLPKEGIRLRHRDGSRGRHTITGLAGVPRGLWERIKPNGMWIRDWRRTFGTVALSNGVELGKVGELLGHKSAQTTKIYAKLLEDEAHAAAAKTAGVMEQMLAKKAIS